MKAKNRFSFEVRPVPPYDFRATLRKPAGWDFINHEEVFEDETLWTAAWVDGRLTGFKVRSAGTVEGPVLRAEAYTKRKLTAEERRKLERTFRALAGADDDLAGFYRFARKDGILRHAVRDLYGMHDTQASSLFNSVVLSICLQMARLERSYQMMEAINEHHGDTVEFDGRELLVGPPAERLALVDPVKLSRECKLGYRGKYVVGSAKMIADRFPSVGEISEMDPARARELLMELPGVGDYSADIINPKAGFPIDAWSVDVFGKLFFGREPKNARDAISRVKREGIRRWGPWAWMGFLYVAQDIGNLSKKLGIELRLT
ncbi:MAG: hypothetical protein HY247_05460 [archaeon]|nr:MAG: hypothetical protein HY247_05460 [archaeon]